MLRTSTICTVAGAAGGYMIAAGFPLVGVVGKVGGALFGAAIGHHAGLAVDASVSDIKSEIALIKAKRQLEKKILENAAANPSLQTNAAVAKATA